MNTYRFTGSSVRDALQRVRDAFGGDALIVSKKEVDGEVQIVAMPATESVPVHHDTSPAGPLLRAADFAAAAGGPAADATDHPGYGEAAPPAARRSADAAAPLADRATPARKAADPVASARNASDPVAAELSALRAMVEQGFASLAQQDRGRSQPGRAKLFSTLVNAGFGVAQARRLADRLPDDEPSARILEWTRSTLQGALRCVDTEDDLVAQGGVYALVGPTGVGKTTTTAKLAARCALRFGAQRIALITTDGYRVAAREQLRSFGRILGVDVHWIQDQEALHAVLADLRDKHLVLIDTVGASQRDRKVADQLEMLSGRLVRRVLLLNAAAQREALEEVVEVYAPSRLAGCIVTKVDEAVRCGGVADVLLQSRLPVHYVTHGQRVPEDIVPAQAEHLAQLALYGTRAAPMPDATGRLPTGSAPSGHRGVDGESAHA
jgi:flagellar biosynthesis protein FlhF